MPTSTVLPLLAVAALGLSPMPSVAPDTASAVVVSREAWVMGTRLTIRAEADTREGAVEATERVVAEVERVEGLLSTWSAETDLGRVNRAPVGRPVRPDPEVARWLAEAAALARRTGRAFDPVVGALVDAWDLRGRGRLPADAELARALSASGPDGILIDEDGVVERRSPAAWIDAGGFGKGAALGSVARALADVDARVLVDLGGQVWLSPRTGTPAEIAVAHPERRSEMARRLLVSHGSVATSGTSERFADVDGTRIGHILDPRTGRPVEAWGSVTVVSGDPLEADGLATALYVMGPEEGPSWAERHGVAALFLVVTEWGLAERTSRPMERYLAPRRQTLPPRGGDGRLDRGEPAGPEASLHPERDRIPCL